MKSKSKVWRGKEALQGRPGRLLFPKKKKQGSPGWESLWQGEDYLHPVVQSVKKA